MIPVEVERRLGDVPAVLVDLALWLADYYGSTPARALELVAPVQAKRRTVRPSPVGRESFGGEPEPAVLTAGQESAVARIVASLDAGGGHVLLAGPTGSGKTEVYLQAAASGARAWTGRHRARPGDRAGAADGGSISRPFRGHRRGPALRAR